MLDFLSLDLLPFLQWLVTLLEWVTSWAFALM